jgi:Rad3-related DNA helicase
MFDIDRINLQAALSRKLNAEDELRVKILQKLADGTKSAVDEAQRYADVLKVIEDGQITTGEIEMLSKKWGMSTDAVKLYLEQLLKSNDELRKMLALMDQLKSKQLELLRAQIQPMLANVQPTVKELQTIILRANVQEGLAKAAPAVQGLKDLLANIPKMAEGGIVNQPTLALIGEAGSEAVVPLNQMGGMGTNVVINVAGSVISEGELQSVIQDALYNLNRSGAVTQLTNLGR